MASPAPASASSVSSAGSRRDKPWRTRCFSRDECIDLITLVFMGDITEEDVPDMMAELDVEMQWRTRSKRFCLLIDTTALTALPAAAYTIVHDYFTSHRPALRQFSAMTHLVVDRDVIRLFIELFFKSYRPEGDVELMRDTLESIMNLAERFNAVVPDDRDLARYLGL